MSVLWCNIVHLHLCNWGIQDRHPQNIQLRKHHQLWILSLCFQLQQHVQGAVRCSDMKWCTFLNVIEWIICNSPHVQKQMERCLKWSKLSVKSIWCNSVVNSKILTWTPIIFPSMNIRVTNAAVKYFKLYGMISHFRTSNQKGFVPFSRLFNAPSNFRIFIYKIKIPIDKCKYIELFSLLFLKLTILRGR